MSTAGIRPTCSACSGYLVDYIQEGNVLRAKCRDTNCLYEEIVPKGKILYRRPRNNGFDTVKENRFLGQDITLPTVKKSCPANCGSEFVRYKTCYVDGNIRTLYACSCGTNFE